MRASSGETSVAIPDAEVTLPTGPGPLGGTQRGVSDPMCSVVDGPRAVAIQDMLDGTHPAAGGSKTCSPSNHSKRVVRQSTINPSPTYVRRYRPPSRAFSVDAVARFRSNSAQFRPRFLDFDRSWTESVRCPAKRWRLRLRQARVRPHSVPICPNRGDLGRLWPKSDKVSQTLQHSEE